MQLTKALGPKRPAISCWLILLRFAHNQFAYTLKTVARSLYHIISSISYSAMQILNIGYSYSFSNLNFCILQLAIIEVTATPIASFKFIHSGLDNAKSNIFLPPFHACSSNSCILDSPLPSSLGANTIVLNAPTGLWTLCSNSRPAQCEAWCLRLRILWNLQLLLQTIGC